MSGWHVVAVGHADKISVESIRDSIGAFIRSMADAGRQRQQVYWGNRMIDILDTSGVRLRVLSKSCPTTLVLGF
jgi:hypothetical protein